MLILLFLFAKSKHKLLIIFIVIPAFLAFLGWVYKNEDLWFYFHLGSLKWRLLYMKNAISQISFSPHNYSVVDKIDFSADNLWLWLAFRWGIIFPVILLFMFAVPGKFLRRKDHRKIYSVFVLTAIISMLSNGTFFTSTVNIFFWFLLGFLAQDKSYAFLTETQKAV